MDLLSRVKLASPARPVCVELSAVWLAFHDVAGVACTAQHAVDTDGEDLTCTPGLASLRSVLIFVRGGVEGTLALECVARIVARFKGEMRMRELRVLLSGPDATPYVAALARHAPRKRSVVANLSAPNAAKTANRGQLLKQSPRCPLVRSLLATFSRVISSRTSTRKTTHIA